MTLLGKLDIDTPIPLEAYAAVAEILSYVYRANDKMKKDSGMTEQKTTTARNAIRRNLRNSSAESHALLEQGAMMELAGLDARVVCCATQVLRLSDRKSAWSTPTNCSRNCYTIS